MRDWWSTYSEYDCGGAEVCSGCSSWRHGVYEDGSGDPEALATMQRAKRKCESEASPKWMRADF